MIFNTYDLAKEYTNDKALKLFIYFTLKENGFDLLQPIQHVRNFDTMTDTFTQIISPPSSNRAGTLSDEPMRKSITGGL
jgi:hypothetical protein